jgi:hypothetical protein
VIARKDSYFSYFGVDQYPETNVMRFWFSLLRSNSSTCFEHYVLILRRRYTTAFFILRACNVSWLQPCHSQLTLYARSITNAVYVSPPEDEQIMLETFKGLWFSINWISASRWFQCTDVLRCTVSKTMNLL